MTKAESFLVVEAFLTRKFREAHAAYTEAKYDQIDALLDIGDYDQATRIANRISLDGLFEELEPSIRWHTNLAMVFGASQVSHTPRTTKVGIGLERLVTDQFVGGFRETFLRIEEYLKTSAVQLIADVQAGKVQVQKAPKKRVLGDFKTFLGANGGAYFDVTASLHTSRVSAYGFTAEADVLGLEYYVINEQLDSRTCPVCRIMHKKKFRVMDAREFLNVTTRVTDPETLKLLNPWPKKSKAALQELSEMSTDALVRAGWHVPPFHPRCRGILGRVGRVPKMSPPGEPIINEGQVVISEFQALGVEITQKQVEEWVKYMRVPPSAILSIFTGLDPNSIILRSLSDGGLEKLLNFFKMKVTEKGVGLVFKPEWMDVQMLFNYATRELLVSNAESILYSDDQKAKSLLANMYLASKDTEMQSIALDANESTGFLWASSGFIPATPEDWAVVQSGIAENAQDLTLSPGEWAIVNSILDSSDPKSLFKLLTLGAVAVTLLAGISWVGKLVLADASAVKLFLGAVSN